MQPDVICGIGKYQWVYERNVWERKR
jgi:hypothetical protein